MAHVTKSIMAGVLVVITGCGGGGGGGSNSDSFAGRWLISFIVTENSCDGGPINPEGGEFRFNQDGDRIVVDGAVSYAGFTTSETTFVATREALEQCVTLDTGVPTGESANGVGVFEFEKTEPDVGQVTLTLEFGDCPGDFRDSSCRATLVGRAERLDE